MVGTTSPVSVQCDPREGCGTVRELSGEVREHERRLNETEGEIKNLHGRITESLKDKIIEQRWLLGLLIPIIITLILQIITLLRSVKP